jgi:hypothetical protein
MSRIRVRLLCSASAAGVATCLIACGGAGKHSVGPAGPLTVRVGDKTISGAVINHWMTVMAPQHAVPVPPRYTACLARLRVVRRGETEATLREECEELHEGLRTRAIDFLIAKYWLIGEAASQGTAVTEPDIGAGLARRKKNFESDAEFRESIQAIGHTLADVELEIQAELAAERIRHSLREQEPAIKQSEVAAYYRQHVKSYFVPEERYFDIGENFPTAAVAKGKMKAVGAGEESIHEWMPRKPYTDYNGEKRTIYEAIFKAKPHVVSQPIRLNNLYFLIDVTRIRPAYVRLLSQVDREIRAKLETERWKHDLAAFISGWRKRWTERTDCEGAGIVNKCRQYTGPKESEAPLSFS